MTRMAWLRNALLAAVLAVTGGASGALAAESAAREKAEGALRVATWNIANFHHAEGDSVPGRDVVRTQEDYTWLRHYAHALNADIVALQEINSRAAAHRLFSRSGWTTVISGRRLDDLQTYDLTGEWPDAAIYTGFAVRRSIAILRAEDVPSLQLLHTDPRTGIARPTRRAVEIEIEHEGQRLILLSVHLKSGCFRSALRDEERGPDRYIDPSDADCTTLARQMGPLRAWIEEKLAGDVPFVILGDFNRAISAAGDSDDLWQSLSGALPGGQTLSRYPNEHEAQCWKDAPPAPFYEDPIDYIVLEPRSAAFALPESFGWVTFDPSLAPRFDKISDHCPAYLDLRFSAPQADPAADPEQAAALMQLRDAGRALMRNNGLQIVPVSATSP